MWQHNWIPTSPHPPPPTPPNLTRQSNNVASFDITSEIPNLVLSFSQIKIATHKAMRLSLIFHPKYNLMDWNWHHHIPRHFYKFSTHTMLTRKFQNLSTYLLYNIWNEDGLLSQQYQHQCDTSVSVSHSLKAKTPKTPTNSKTDIKSFTIYHRNALNGCKMAALLKAIMW